MLLGLSVLAWAVARTGLFPTQITALGVTLTSSDRAAVMTIFALVLLYFLLAFIVYASVDVLVWRTTYRGAREDAAMAEAQRRYEAEQQGAQNVVIGIEAAPRFHWVEPWIRGAVPVAVVARVLWDVALPALVGTVATVSLFMSR